jgi:hypothetical protein
MKNFTNEINQFYPAYLKAHNDMTNQVLHFIGATLFFVLLGIGLYQLNLFIILTSIFIGYLLPGIGHRFFQHNDSFRASKPILCVACAGKLYWDTLTFQIKRKMKEV